eukprot:GFYU01001212.1.p1 GENE.GFYU01001212.1~~GFYU01001212.1.p1  ORF type:complete len:251 (-),score=44.53 GFYU01001212.1:247-999(-)
MVPTAIRRGSCLVVGAGSAIGGAIAKRFAREGMSVAVTRRQAEPLQQLVDEITASKGTAKAYPCDARKEEDVINLFNQVENDLGELEVVVYNIGAWYNESILTMSTRKYYKVWEMACFSGFLTGREAAKRMVPRGKGTIIFTGATASTRGNAGFAAFAGAKSGLRALAQSMQGELWPQGIHVGHIIVDAPVDTPVVRELMQKFGKEEKEDGMVDPRTLAENYYHMHMQPRDAWTFEMDIRPYCEPMGSKL